MENRPAQQLPSKIQFFIMGIVAVGFALLMALGGIVAFYTNWLWFGEVGFVQVFWKELGVKWSIGAIFAAAFFALLYVNVWLARRFAPMYPPLQVVEPGVSPFGRPGQPVSVEDLIGRVRAVIDPYVNKVLLGIVVVLSIGQGMAAGSKWLDWLRFAYQVPFGKVDPLFGKDLSFYFFTLPAYVWIYDWLMSALVVTTIVVALVHVYDGAIRFTAGPERFSPHVKAHLSVLLGLIALVKAWGYNLQMYHLLYSPRGAVTGASYTDVHAQLPALKLLVAVSVITAGLLIINIRFKGFRLPVVAVGLWLSTSIVAGGIYPALVQKYKVGPDEQRAERPYINLNIAATLDAYGLSKVRTRDFPAASNLTAADLAEDSQTINNIRLWDPTTLKTTYGQLQEIRLYYNFTDVDVDRYKLDGELREVMISPRELDIRQIPERAQTWVNQHVIYTHGFGAVVSPVNRVTTDGLPDFIIKDIPPESTTNLKITQPRLYYGEQPDNYVIVRTGRASEFDYPSGTANKKTQYSGKGGIELSNFWRKAAFAVKYGSLQMFLSPYATPTSKIMFRRNVRDRISDIAPFLYYDSDPYVAIVAGRLVFIQDAYTISDRYPYSQMLEGMGNYIRNSVKVTVDAYDGTVRFWLIDKKDPIAATYAKIFPGLFSPGDKVPAEVRAHFRYPENMFLVQADIYRTYHMKDPDVFYNREDQWAIPTIGSANGSQQMQPYYVLMRPPGSSAEKFILFIPFTPNGKNNMVAWMAASSDPADYGQLLAFDFPKKKLTFGPAQIDARVNQDPEISKQLTLWSQAGSTVMRGNLLVIPIKDAILYVQPLYLQAEQSALPQLERVIVAFGDRVAMEPTFAEALEQVFGEAAPQVEKPTGTGKKPAEQGKEPVPPRARETVKSLAAQAAKHYSSAQEAAKRGDWATYGREIKALGATLKKLEDKSGAGVAP